MDEEEDLRGGGGRKRDRPDSTFRGRGGGSGPNRRDQENRPEYEVPRGGYFFLHDDRDGGGFGMKRQRTWGTEATSRSRVDIADKWTHDKFEDDVREEDNDAKRSDASGSRRGEVRFERGGTEAAEEGGLSRRGRSDRDDSNDEEEEQHTARRFAERESRDRTDDEDDDDDEDKYGSRNNNNNGNDNRDEDGSTVEASTLKDSLLDEMV